MVEVEGKIFYHLVFILIDPSASLSYVNPRIVDVCHLKISKFKSPWLVQLAIGAKRRVCAKVEGYEIKFAKQQIRTDLNVLPLGSYDVLIDMHWLE